MSSCSKCLVHCQKHDELFAENINLKEQIEELEKQLAEKQVDFDTLKFRNEQSAQLIISNMSPSTCKLVAENAALKHQCVQLRIELNRMAARLQTIESTLEKHVKVDWSVNMREAVRVLCSHLSLINKSDEKIKRFINANKNSEPQLTLSTEDIKDILDYQEVLCSYLSSEVHQEYSIQIINKVPAELSHGDVIEYKFAGQQESESIEIDRKVINNAIALINKGYASYTFTQK